ncbi:MAG: hypothetical protein ACI85O_000598 [Saprospiraceae bacterium]|jgi:hypothetical protein
MQLSKKYFNQPTSIAPLVTFRVLFGALMAFGAVRFWTNGWIEKLYLEPKLFFKFYGFEWVQMPGETAIYGLFALVIISALGITFGLFYRLSAVLFFLSFTWTQLIDGTNYLNHYYLVCLLGFLMIFIPAHRSHSLDVLRKPSLKLSKVPAWCINILIFQLCCVYFFAGLAKINYEWIFRAMPMTIWLPERVDTPLLGYFFRFKWVAFAFSWAGAVYDLTIWAFLLNRKTRTIAYIFVVIFHILTKVLFNIGLFPVIMIFGTLIFFSPEWHEKLWNKLSKRRKEEESTTIENYVKVKHEESSPKWGLGGALITLFILFQLLFPLRHLLYSGNILWTEEAYRFSWRVMLVEKSGNATFYIKDSASPKKQEIVNGSHLTFYQEKQMAIQPDFILQYAHFLKKKYETQHGFKDAIVTVESYVAMNGRSSRQFIDSTVNLSKIKDTFAPRKWVFQ